MPHIWVSCCLLNLACASKFQDAELIVPGVSACASTAANPQVFANHVPNAVQLCSSDGWLHVSTFTPEHMLSHTVPLSFLQFRIRIGETSSM